MPKRQKRASIYSSNSLPGSVGKGGADSTSMAISPVTPSTVASAATLSFMNSLKSRIGTRSKLVYLQPPSRTRAAGQAAGEADEAPPVEVVEIPNMVSAEEVRALLLAACDLPPTFEATLTLVDGDGNVVPTTYLLSANTRDTPYHVQLDVGARAEAVHLLADIQAGLAQVQLQMEAQPLKRLVLPQFHVRPRNPKPDSFFADKPKYEFTEATRDYLKTVGFDNWQWDYGEIIGLFEVMFEDLGLIEEFKLDRTLLRNFLNAVRMLYRANPFHNFRHSFCVTQMMYGMLHMTGLVNQLKPVEKLALTLACIGHDLDHPGFNNAYQVNALTDLALTYNDVAPLENHHCAVLFIILNREESDLLGALPDATYSEVRKTIIKCILATDMAKHGDIISAFKKVTAEHGMNWEDGESRSLLLQMVIKCSDISNEVRPNNISDPWVDCLLEEFFTQSDTEKALGLPTAPFMDRDKVTKASAQVGFIGFVMIPLFETLGKVLPLMEETIIFPIRQALAYYKECLEREKKASSS